MEGEGVVVRLADGGVGVGGGDGLELEGDVVEVVAHHLVLLLGFHAQLAIQEARLVLYLLVVVKQLGENLLLDIVQIGGGEGRWVDW